MPYLGEHRKNLKVMSRAVQFAVGAGALAVEDAGLDPAQARPRAVRDLHGDRDHADGRGRTGRARSPRGSASDGGFDVGRFAAAQAESIFPLWLLKHLPNMAAAHLSILHHAMGPNNTIVTACAAGTQAVGEAFRLIRRGDADVMMAGGCDSRLDPLMMVAYQAMKAVSSSSARRPRSPAPFDGQRDGFMSWARGPPS